MRKRVTGWINNDLLNKKAGAEYPNEKIYFSGNQKICIKATF